MFGLKTVRLVESEEFVKDGEEMFRTFDDSRHVLTHHVYILCHLFDTNVRRKWEKGEVLDDNGVVRRPYIQDTCQYHALDVVQLVKQEMNVEEFVVRMFPLKDPSEKRFLLKAVQVDG